MAMHNAALAPHRHRHTSVHLPPIRSTNTTSTPAQYRAAGNLAHSRVAGRRAAADAELNLMSSYRKENYSKPLSQSTIYIIILLRSTKAQTSRATIMKFSSESKTPRSSIIKYNHLYGLP